MTTTSSNNLHRGEVPGGPTGGTPQRSASRPTSHLKASDPPAGTGQAGTALWESITGGFDLEPHELAQLSSACRVADRVAALDEVVDRDGVMLSDDKRGPVAHPALVESRQQRMALARILSALRLPDAEGQQPQHRGIRGFYRAGARGTA